MTQQHTEGMVTEFEPLSPAHQGPAGGIETPNQPKGSDTMSTMTNDETYNGWANRETWAFNLHWQNGQGLYNETLSAARFWLDRNDVETGQHDSRLGSYVVNYWQERIDAERRLFTDGVAQDQVLAMFEREVGSWWRINYAEVGAAVRESLSAEGE